MDDSSSHSDSNVKVAVRVRPLNRRGKSLANLETVTATVTFLWGLMFLCIVVKMVVVKTYKPWNQI